MKADAKMLRRCLVSIIKSQQRECLCSYLMKAKAEILYRYLLTLMLFFFFKLRMKGGKNETPFLCILYVRFFEISSLTFITYALFVRVPLIRASFFFRVCCFLPRVKNQFSYFSSNSEICAFIPTNGTSSNPWHLSLMTRSACCIFLLVIRLR